MAPRKQNRNRKSRIKKTGQIIRKANLRAMDDAVGKARFIRLSTERVLDHAENSRAVLKFNMENQLQSTQHIADKKLRDKAPSIVKRASARNKAITGPMRKAQQVVDRDRNDMKAIDNRVLKHAAEKSNLKHNLNQAGKRVLQKQLGKRIQSHLGNRVVGAAVKASKAAPVVARVARPVVSKALGPVSLAIGAVDTARYVQKRVKAYKSGNIAPNNFSAQGNLRKFRNSVSTPRKSGGKR